MRKIKVVTKFDEDVYIKKIAGLNDDDLVTEFKGLKGRADNQRVLKRKLNIIIAEVNKRGAERINDEDEDVW